MRFLNYINGNYANDVSVTSRSLIEGATLKDILHALIENGWDDNSAHNILRDATRRLSELGTKEAREAAHRDAHRDLAWGLGLIVVGGGITIATYASASGGGVYFLFFGPVIWGGIRLIRGIFGNASTIYRLGAIVVAAIVFAIGLVVYSGNQVRPVATGDCLDRQGISTDCGSVSHRYNVDSVVEIPDREEYPGESYFESLTNNECPRSTEWFFSPTLQTWNAGDRSILCATER